MRVVCEIDWLDTDFGLTLLNGGDVVASSDTRELFELHDVAGERSRLITEDVLDLAQLLVDVGALGACGEVLIIIIHLHVPVHERTLEELDHLQGY